MRYFEKIAVSNRDAKKKSKKNSSGYSVSKAPDSFSAAATQTMDNTVPAAENSAPKKTIGGRIKEMYGNAKTYIANKGDDVRTYMAGKGLEASTLTIPEKAPTMSSDRALRMQERVASPQHKGQTMLEKATNQNPHDYNRLDRDYYKQNPDQIPARQRPAPEKSLAMKRTFTPEERASRLTVTTDVPATTRVTRGSGRAERMKARVNSPDHRYDVIFNNYDTKTGPGRDRSNRTGFNQAPAPITTPEPDTTRITRGAGRADRMKARINDPQHAVNVGLNNIYSRTIHKMRGNRAETGSAFIRKDTSTPITAVQGGVASAPEPTRTPVMGSPRTQVPPTTAGTVASSADNVAGKAGLFTKETYNTVKDKVTDVISSGKTWAKANPKMAIGAGAAASAAVAGAGALAYNAFRPKSFAEQATKFVKKNPLMAGAAALGLGGAAAFGMSKKSSLEDIINSPKGIMLINKVKQTV